MEYLVPAVGDFMKNKSYLRRLTALQACSLMMCTMDNEPARLEVLLKLLEMSTDPVSYQIFLKGE